MRHDESLSDLREIARKSSWKHCYTYCSNSVNHDNNSPFFFVLHLLRTNAYVDSLVFQSNVFKKVKEKIVVAH